MIDANVILENLRKAGFGQYVDAATEGLETVCSMAGYQRAPAAPAATQSLVLARPVFTPSSTPSPSATPTPSPTPTPTPTPTPENPLMTPCSPLISLIRTQYLANCGFVPNECLERWIELAVILTSYPEVRDDFGIPDINLETTGLVPTGTTANGQPTIFDANFNVAPGHSILLRTQDYSLPFNPRCLWGALAFNAGVDSENYKHVNFKIFVGPKDVSGSFPMMGGPLREWSPRRFIYGSEFRCGDSCSEIPLRSYTGCTDIDIVGLNSAIYIQIDNLATASNNITGQQMVVRLGGFSKPCCDSCGMGKECSSGCKNNGGH